MMDGKSIRNKLIGSDDERAVSPVIGVILMVAITVILAAVIAAFVLDMGGNMNQEAQAGVNIEAGNNTVDTTWSAEGNADSIDITIEIIKGESGSVSDYQLNDGSSTNTELTGELTSVGGSNTYIVETNGGTEGDEVTVSVQAVANSGDTSTVVQEATKTVVATSP